MNEFASMNPATSPTAWDGHAVQRSAERARVPGQGRLRLLALGPQDVFPPVDGGKEGIFGALQALARLCDVTYVYPGAAPSKPLDGYLGAGVRAVPLPWMPVETPALIAGATLRLRPYKFEKYCTAQAVKTCLQHLPDTAYDGILCFHAHTARLGEALREALGLRVPVVVREHNIEYELVASYRSFLKPLARLAAWPFEKLTVREEQRIWRQADAVAFLSDRDLATAQASGVPGRFVLAREGIPTPPRRQAHAPGRDAALLVLLNPKATQSVANLRDFVHRYWLQAAQDPRVGDTALHVTGLSTPELARLIDVEAPRLQAARVQGLGFLQELAPTLASSLALVSPTFVGGGIRKKVLEAMAHQLPVIATQLDLDTCAYFTAGENILDMGNLEHFCTQVQRLRDDPALWSRLSEAGRSTVETYASWDRCAATLVTEIETLIQR